MGTIQRPVKEGNARTYQEKVGLGFVDILASEVDADLDTIYAAWNGGADAINIKDGAVTTVKLADAPNGVTTGKLTDGAVTAAKLALGAPVNNVNTAAGPVSYSWTNTAGAESGALISTPVLARGGTVLIHNHVSWYVATTTAGACIVLMRLKRDGVEVASRRYDVLMPANAMASLAGFSFVDVNVLSGARTYTVTITLFGPTGATVRTPDNCPGYLNLCALS